MSKARGQVPDHSSHPCFEKFGVSRRHACNRTRHRFIRHFTKEKGRQQDSIMINYGTRTRVTVSRVNKQGTHSSHGSTPTFSPMTKDDMEFVVLVATRGLQTSTPTHQRQVKGVKAYHRKATLRFVILQSTICIRFRVHRHGPPARTSVKQNRPYALRTSHQSSFRVNIRPHVEHVKTKGSHRPSKGPSRQQVPMTIRGSMYFTSLGPLLLRCRVNRRVTRFNNRSTSAHTCRSITRPITIIRLPHGTHRNHRHVTTSTMPQATIPMFLVRRHHHRGNNHHVTKERQVTHKTVKARRTRKMLRQVSHHNRRPNKRDIKSRRTSPQTTTFSTTSLRPSRRNYKHVLRMVIMVIIRQPSMAITRATRINVMGQRRNSTRGRQRNSRNRTMAFNQDPTIRVLQREAFHHESRALITRAIFGLHQSEAKGRRRHQRAGRGESLRPRPIIRHFHHETQVTSPPVTDDRIRPVATTRSHRTDNSIQGASPPGSAVDAYPTTVTDEVEGGSQRPHERMGAR